MSRKAHAAQEEVKKLARAYVRLQDEFEEREAAFRHALTLPDVIPRGQTGLHPSMTPRSEGTRGVEYCYMTLWGPCPEK